MVQSCIQQGRADVDAIAGVRASYVRGVSFNSHAIHQGADSAARGVRLEDTIFITGLVDTVFVHGLKCWRLRIT